MNNLVATLAPIIGRILIGGYFLWSGIQNTLNFAGFVTELGYGGFPQPVACAALIIAIEALGGLALVTNCYTRFSALTLSLYLTISTVAFFKPLSATDLQLFLSDIAILGGLLITAAYGRGRYSKDWPRK
jgi:putative oxidoreductase